MNETAGRSDDWINRGADFIRPAQTLLDGGAWTNQLTEEMISGWVFNLQTGAKIVDFTFVIDDADAWQYTYSLTGVQTEALDPTVMLGYKILIVTGESGVGTIMPVTGTLGVQK